MLHRGVQPVPCALLYHQKKRERERERERGGESRWMEVEERWRNGFTYVCRVWSGSARSSQPSMSYLEQRYYYYYYVDIIKRNTKKHIKINKETY